MNKTLGFTLASALLATSLSSPVANARVVGDINGAMTKLLGHAPKVVNINDAQTNRLDRAVTQFQPWSGSYWPDINGGINNHWHDHDLLWAQLRFGLRYDVANGTVKRDTKDVQEKFSSWDNEKLNKKLSPAEKYDLLLGDTNFTFTHAIMDEADFRADHRLSTKKRDGSESDTDADEGSDNNNFLTDVQDDQGNTLAYSKYDNEVEYRYWKKKGGSLAYWSGICDGWSPASIYLPRPAKPVTVTGALGQRITFYPDDLKALGSYMFARTNTPYFTTMNYRFAGRKCDEKGTPSQDGSGYVKDIRCNDLDPAVFHLALLNRVGLDKMGFVMDVDNNLKINNHPITSYEMSYFNPATGKEGSLKESMAARFSFTDGYLKRRSPDMKYLVGVKTKVNYMFYLWPESKQKGRSQDFDNAAQDKLDDQTYTYDLELDANGNILGGEWGTRADDSGQVDEDGNQIAQGVSYAKQPDFIWMADTNALPYSEMSVYASAGFAKDASNPRPFGNMNWAWDGKGKLPEDWIRAAKADSTWAPPAVGEKIKNKDTKVEDVFPAEAKNGILKSAQPLSHIVYYLFDQARMPNQK
jgi:hypothetical protein